MTRKASSRQLMHVFAVLAALAAVLLLAALARHYPPGVHGSSAAGSEAASARGTGMVSNGNETASGVIVYGSYFSAVEKLKDILEKARSIYLDALREGRRWEVMIYEPLSNFSRLFVLNATIVDWRTLMIGHGVYRYVIVRLYDSADKFSFEPTSIGVDGILVERLPRNKMVTYTGVVPYSYLVRYKGLTCRAELVSPGFVEAAHRLTVRASRICDNVYLLGVAVSEKLGSTAYVDTVWLVLVKQ